MPIIGVVGLSNAGKDTVAQLISNKRLIFINEQPLNLYKEDRFAYPFEAPLRQDAEHIAFADPIKIAAMDWWKFSIEQLWGPSEKRNAPDKRYPRTHDFHEVQFINAPDDVRDHCTRCGATRNRPVIIGNEAWTGPCKDYLTPREALQFMGTEVGRQLWGNTWAHAGIRRALGQLHLSLDPKHPKVVLISDVRFPNEVDFIRHAGGRIWRVERPGAGLKDAKAMHESERYAHTLDVDHTIVNDGDLGALSMKVHKVLVQTNA